MQNVKIHDENGTPVVELIGRIGTENAADVENEILQALNDMSGTPIVDAEQLTYISSAGLRIFLRLRKNYPGLKVINTTPSVYDIFEVTGFTEMMTIERGYRRISIDGCEEIGGGANGIVYRYDPETVVKVWRAAGSLDDIKRERELARRAFVLGVPTAISYDIVRVGDRFGSVFELLDASSLSSMVADDPDHMDIYVKKFVDLLKLIHSTEVKPDELPDMKEKYISYVNDLKPYLSEATIGKLETLLAAVPDSCKMLHGDYHTKNVMSRDGEEMLIDMDTLSRGDPVFEFASIYNAYVGFGVIEHERVSDFIGMSYAQAGAFWRKTLEAYLGTDSEARVDAAERKAHLLGSVRLLRRTIRRDGEGTPLARKCREDIEQLAAQVDSLAF